jgi:hypothetical protein
MQDITSKQMERQVDLWEQVREQVYTCFKRAGDALFNLTDALLSESQAKSLAEWSLSPSFQRKWPSVYEALEDGTIDVAKLRAVWVEALLAQSEPEELIWIAVDSSVIERPDAHTSEDRGIIHLSNLPLVNKPIGVGWTVSSVVLLPDAPSSWVPILDVQRVATSQTPIGVAIAQLQALKPLLGKRRVILLADRGSCTPKFLRACHELGISVIIRMKSDRRLYRPPVRLHPKGPMRHPTVPFSNDLTAYCTPSAWLACVLIFANVLLGSVLIRWGKDRNPMIIRPVHGDQTSSSPIHKGLSRDPVSFGGFVGGHQTVFS